MIDTLLQTLNIEFLLLQVLNYSDICTVCVKKSLKSKFLEMFSYGLLIPKNVRSEKKTLNLCLEKISYLVWAIFVTSRAPRHVYHIICTFKHVIAADNNLGNLKIKICKEVSSIYEFEINLKYYIPPS